MGNRKPRFVGKKRESKVQVITAEQYEANDAEWRIKTAPVAVRVCDSDCKNCSRVCPMRRW